MGGPARYVLLVAALAVASCGVEARLPAPAGPGPTAATTSLPTTSTAPPSTTTSTTVPPCDASVASWPLADRLEQVLMVGGEFADLGASAGSASAGVGALVLFGQPPAGARPAITSGLAALVGAAASNGHVKPWFATDEEGGTVARLANVIGPLPSARRMAAQWSAPQVQLAAAEHAAAMRVLGIDMDLAPVVDVASSDDAVADEADRSFSDDPAVVAVYGAAFEAGLTAGGVTAVAKHFPGLGRATANTDITAATGPSLAALEARDLVPFERSVRAHVPVVMVSHMSVPDLTGRVPASLSPATYALLRNLGFTGVALTDALGAGAVTAAGFSQPAAAVAAIEAGADMAMIDASAWPSTVDALEQAVASGALAQSRLNSAVATIVSAKNLCA